MAATNNDRRNPIVIRLLPSMLAEIDAAAARHGVSAVGVDGDCGAG